MSCIFLIISYIGPEISEAVDPSREEEAAFEAQNAAKEEEADVGGEDEPED